MMTLSLSRLSTTSSNEQSGSLHPSTSTVVSSVTPSGQTSEEKLTVTGYTPSPPKTYSA